MSGSGGGGFSGGFDVIEVTCEKLVIDTQLSSPKEDVVDLIQDGDILDVALTQMAGGTVIVVLHNGQIAGGLASPQLLQLRRCIESGTEYVAKVTSKRAGQIRVRVAIRSLV
jgi:hypothetical protein